MSSSPSRFRPEIQGLRAVAVLAVLLYHIWPKSLPGGYVGVDVFFVISGYLITGVLLREVESSGSISLLSFYQRRIKRLLPAATVTLLGSAIAYTLLPVVGWLNAAKGIIASTLYVQNWWLASQATDYLAQDDAAGPLQHFWSLSVEEQYYIAWPLVIVAAVAIARRVNIKPQIAIGISLIPIGVLSLAYSIDLSNTEPGLAYFATTTRAWELALGGAIALWPYASNLEDRASRIVAAIGLTMIGVACFSFDRQTNFPGYAALLPTLGTAGIIVAGDSESKWSIYYLLRQRLCQYYGDLSYSLYLWHWPVIIFYTQLTGRTPTIADGAIIFFISGALAHQTKFLVEDRFRLPGGLGGRRWQTFLFAAVCMSLSASAGLWIRHSFARRISDAATTQTKEQLFSARQESPSKPPEFSTHQNLSSEDQRIVAAVRAREDKPPWYGGKCKGERKTTIPTACVYGQKDSKFHVAVIGDSHAIHWEPTFIELAEQRSWKVSVYAKTACSMGDHPVVIGTPQVRYGSCDVYRKNLLEILTQDQPNLVVIAQSRGHVAFDVERSLVTQTVAESLIRTIRVLEAAGIRAVLMADTPWLKENAVECLTSPRFTPGSCDYPVDEPFRLPDPAQLAGQLEPSLTVLNMNQHLCDDKRCRAMIDGMVVYRDHHHMTATFAKSLAARLGVEISKRIPEISP